MNTDLLEPLNNSRLGRQVARFAYLHSSSSDTEFLQKWEKSLENPGGEERYIFPGTHHLVHALPASDAGGVA